MDNRGTGLETGFNRERSAAAAIPAALNRTGAVR